MDDSTPPQSENDWTVMISVREREGQTQATARLRSGDHSRWEWGYPGSVLPSTALQVPAANWPLRGLCRISRGSCRPLPPTVASPVFNAVF